MSSDGGTQARLTDDLWSGNEPSRGVQEYLQAQEDKGVDA